jgi:8-oxo-dGTP pyrophosphatase MutT (NUDIX family)
MSLPTRLALHLSDRERTVLDASSSRPCGVLLAMLPVADGYEILYTLRSEQLPNHKGQVAFPGGKHAPGDGTLMDTALREAHEEVGITPADVHVLGCLDDVYTMATDYVITPYVGLLPPSYAFNANPHEVSELFTVALGDLRNPEYHGVTDRNWRGQSFPVDVITAGPHIIWGATHSITTNLIECLGELLE